MTALVLPVLTQCTAYILTDSLNISVYESYFKKIKKLLMSFTATCTNIVFNSKTIGKYSIANKILFYRCVPSSAQVVIATGSMASATVGQESLGHLAISLALPLLLV